MELGCCRPAANWVRSALYRAAVPPADWVRSALYRAAVPPADWVRSALFRAAVPSDDPSELPRSDGEPDSPLSEDQRGSVRDFKNLEKIASIRLEFHGWVDNGAEAVWRAIVFGAACPCGARSRVLPSPLAGEAAVFPPGMPRGSISAEIPGFNTAAFESYGHTRWPEQPDEGGATGSCGRRDARPVYSEEPKPAPNSIARWAGWGRGISRCAWRAERIPGPPISRSASGPTPYDGEEPI